MSLSIYPRCYLCDPVELWQIPAQHTPMTWEYRYRPNDPVTKTYGHVTTGSTVVCSCPEEGFYYDCPIHRHQSTNT